MLLRRIQNFNTEKTKEHRVAQRRNPRPGAGTCPPLEDEGRDQGLASSASVANFNTEQTEEHRVAQSGVI